MAEGQDSRGSAARDLSEGLSAVVGAALGVGASIAKVVAQATAGGKPIADPAPNAGPINAMVHYGVAAVTNVAGMVLGSVSGVRMQAPAAQSRSPDPATATRPRVHQGATLRIPLSVENPSERPMLEAAFRCSALHYDGNASGVALSQEDVRFDPPVLNIMSRDFEKLTVHIATHEDTAVGPYRARIDLGTGDFEIAIDFEVVAA